MNYIESQSNWTKLTIAQQMANVGADVGRAVKWKEMGNIARAHKARDRALELFDITIENNKHRSREVARARELFCDYFFENNYKTSAKYWDKYFLQYNYLARIKT